MASEAKQVKFSPEWEAELKGAAFDYRLDCTMEAARAVSGEISEEEFQVECKRHLKKWAKRTIQATVQEIVSQMLFDTRPLTWRERLFPRWRIFQWLHDAWYGEATFVCGERLNLHRGAELEDWVAGLFGREE